MQGDDKSQSYLVFKNVGSVIPIDKHPLPSVIQDNCDFIVAKSDI